MLGITLNNESDKLFDTNLSKLAYNQIKEKIINGELQQGSLISISAMSKKLNISRTPITSACQQLEYEGFLTIVPKQGVIVRTLTINDAREVHELRAAIETYAAKCAFPQIGPNDILYLEDSYQRQVRLVAQNDTYGFMREDLNFHKYLLNKYENSKFFTVINLLYERTFLLGIENLKKCSRLQDCLIEHREIIDSLINKDREHFVEKTEWHIINGFQSLTSSGLK